MAGGYSSFDSRLGVAAAGAAAAGGHTRVAGLLAASTSGSWVPCGQATPCLCPPRQSSCHLPRQCLCPPRADWPSSTARCSCFPAGVPGGRAVRRALPPAPPGRARAGGEQWKPSRLTREECRRRRLHLPCRFDCRFEPWHGPVAWYGCLRIAPHSPFTRPSTHRWPPRA